MARTNRRFNEYLLELKAYVQKHGHANVPARMGALGPWLNQQRLRARRGKLPPERFDALRALGVPVDRPPRRARPKINTANPTTRVAASLDELLSEGRRFGTIYLDPPWKYDNSGTRAAAEHHYGCMSVDELKQIPISALAARDAHLFLWVTHAHLPYGFELMTAWGFEYRSFYVWVKPRIGLGNYWRLAHETLLLGIRGDAKRFNIRNWRSWEEWPVGRHSAKPEPIRTKIEQSSPGPYLEVFGRRAAPGWTVVGNQIGHDLIDQTHLAAPTRAPAAQHLRKGSSEHSQNTMVLA